MPERPVREILTRPTVVTATPATSVREAVRRMAAHACGSVVVLDDGGRLVGIFTERDLARRVVAPGRDPDTTPLAAVMTREVETIPAEAPVAAAIRAMDAGGYRHLPVVAGERVVGVLAPEDIPLGELVRLADELETRHRLAERLW